MDSSLNIEADWELGETGVQELAAAYSGHDIVTSSEIEAVASSSGFSCNRRDAVKLRSGIASQLPVGVAAWKRGVAAAHALREQESLGLEPLSNNRLCQMLGVTSAAIDQRQKRGTLTFEYDKNGAQGNIVLKSGYETGRRFNLARLLGDTIAGSVSGPLKVAQRTYTYRQKLQRAFAGEFLCPFEALEKTLDGDTSDDAIHEAAQHFNVADITVRTLLVNNRVIERDSLDDFDMQSRSVG